MDENYPPVQTYDQYMVFFCVSRTNYIQCGKNLCPRWLGCKRNINSNNARRKVGGPIESRIVGPVPKGRALWTIRLLENQVKIEFAEPISRKAIRRTLKKRLRPHCSQYWYLLNQADTEFVAYMEDIFDVYEMPYYPTIPVVCVDGKPYYLLDVVRNSWVMRPGDDKKVNDKYTRNGTSSIFAFIEPLGGMHHVSVREQRTAKDRQRK